MGFKPVWGETPDPTSHRVAFRNQFGLRLGGLDTGQEGDFLGPEPGVLTPRLWGRSLQCAPL